MRHLLREVMSSWRYSLAKKLRASNVTSSLAAWRMSTSAVARKRGSIFAVETDGIFHFSAVLARVA